MKSPRSLRFADHVVLAALAATVLAAAPLAYALGPGFGCPKETPIPAPCIVQFPVCQGSNPCTTALDPAGNPLWNTSEQVPNVDLFGCGDNGANLTECKDSIFNTALCYNEYGCMLVGPNCVPNPQITRNRASFVKEEFNCR